MPYSTVWPFSWLLGKVAAALDTVLRTRVAITCYPVTSRGAQALQHASVELEKLSGEEWLRLLASGVNWSACSEWCQACRQLQFGGHNCGECHRPLTTLDSAFWHDVGTTIRATLASKRTLLAEVKATWQKTYGMRFHPQFPAELGWLAHAWSATGNPPHRPFDPTPHYAVANWVRTLQARGLSQDEIVDIMAGMFEEDAREGPIMNGKKDYAKIPVQDLRVLSQQFKQRMGYVPGSLLYREELWRTLEWVDRQRDNPMARLRGERVRLRSVKSRLTKKNSEQEE